MVVIADALASEPDELRVFDLVSSIDGMRLHQKRKAMRRHPCWSPSENWTDPTSRTDLTGEHCNSSLLAFLFLRLLEINEKL